MIIYGRRSHRPSPPPPGDRLATKVPGCRVPSHSPAVRRLTLPPPSGRLPRHPPLSPSPGPPTPTHSVDVHVEPVFLRWNGATIPAKESLPIPHGSIFCLVLGWKNCSNLPNPQPNKYFSPTNPPRDRFFSIGDGRPVCHFDVHCARGNEACMTSSRRIGQTGRLRPRLVNPLKPKPPRWRRLLWSSTK